MTRFLFYLNYAYQNIRRGRRWSALAIFCIAAGVATVVALRSLGLGIGDALIGSVRTDNKGDIRLWKPNRGDSFGSFFTFGEDAPAFTSGELVAVQNRVAEMGGRLTAYTRGGSLQVTKIGAEGVESPQSVTIMMIDPQTYPVTGEIRALDPANVPLAKVFTDGNDIVISQNLSEQQNIHVGDTVRVGGTTTEFTVRAIVSSNYEAGFQNIFSSFFGFAYIDLQDAKVAIGEGIDPNTIGIVFDNPPTGQALEDAARELDRIASPQSGATRFQTVEQALETRETISQLIGDFIVVLGLGALLIGGVGILNTMLVMVRRRTVEIAALKTFGLKGRQVAALFLAEGLILGLLGSVLGSLMGLLLSGIVNQYGEAFLQQQIVWKLYPEALVYGFALGMVTTVIFGLAPIVTALRVRPGIILRPNETHIPTTGVLQTLALMVIITVLIGLVVGQIISPSFGLVSRFNVATPYLAGIVGVAFTLIFLGVLVLLLWMVVWLVGKMPSFGSVTLHLALRNLSTNRLRTATTLLALCAGMFALSSITFVGEGTRQLLNLQLSQQFGGNVLVFPLAPGALQSVGEFAVDNAIAGVDGVTARTTVGFYEFRLVAVDGAPVSQDAPIRVEGRPRPEDLQNVNPVSMATFMWGNVTVWDSTNPDIYDAFPASVGVPLFAEDRGKQVVVGPLAYADPLGIKLGSTLTYDLGGRRVDFEVVGFTDQGFGGFSGGGAMMPPEAFSGPTPDFQLYTFQVEPEHVNEALVALSTIRIPPTFSLDISLIDNLLKRFIDQFAAIPTVVGLLSLFAAAVIMANTVALATLERQRQIGILKSIGLKSRRVLTIMLIESGIIGLLSAVLGIGLSSLFVTLLTGLGGSPIPIPDDARLVAVGLVAAAMLISWLATFLSASVAVRERVMNVLRYE